MPWRTLGRISSGHFRPVQNAFQIFVLVTGVYGLITGPIAGQPLAIMLGEDKTAFSYVFYGALVLGGLASITGEILQHLHPLFDTKRRQSSVIAFLDAQSIEAAGNVLIAANYLSLAIVIVMSDAVSADRSIFHWTMFLGFSCRSIQILNDTRSLRKQIRTSSE